VALFTFDEEPSRNFQQKCVILPFTHFNPIFPKFNAFCQCGSHAVSITVVEQNEIFFYQTLKYFVLISVITGDYLDCDVNW